LNEELVRVTVEVERLHAENMARAATIEDVKKTADEEAQRELFAAIDSIAESFAVPQEATPPPVKKQFPIMGAQMIRPIESIPWLEQTPEQKEVTKKRRQEEAKKRVAAAANKPKKHVSFPDLCNAEFFVNESVKKAFVERLPESERAEVEAYQRAEAARPRTPKELALDNVCGAMLAGVDLITGEKFDDIINGKVTFKKPTTSPKRKVATPPTTTAGPVDVGPPIYTQLQWCESESAKKAVKDIGTLKLVEDMAACNSNSIANMFGAIQIPTIQVGGGLKVQSTLKKGEWWGSDVPRLWKCHLRSWSQPLKLALQHYQWRRRNQSR
jgi:hypothetical protein